MFRKVISGKKLEPVNKYFRQKCALLLPHLNIAENSKLYGKRVSIILSEYTPFFTSTVHTTALKNYVLKKLSGCGISRQELVNVEEFLILAVLNRSSLTVEMNTA